MGNYQLPNTSAGLINLGTDNVSGMQTYGTALDIKLITIAQCQGNLAAFIQQDGIYNGARSGQQTASDNYQAALDAVYPWLLGVSNTLATRFGTRWNMEWAQAGFINNTTAVPAKIEDRLALIVALANFFTANPSYEVPSMNQTAVYGTNLRQTAITAQQALTVAQIKFNDAGTAWNTAYTTLTDGMRALLRNLSSVLDDHDPRWLSFGFGMPATPTTPGKPVNVVAQLDLSGAIVVTCDAVPLATRYRFRRMILGVETSYTLATSSKEPIGSITDILPGQTVQIVVQAVNGNLQGVASDPIQFTIPPVASRTEATEPATSHTTPASPVRSTAGMGDVATTGSNGHANGSRQPSLA